MLKLVKQQQQRPKVERKWKLAAQLGERRKHLEKGPGAAGREQASRSRHTRVERLWRWLASSILSKML